MLGSSGPGAAIPPGQRGAPALSSPPSFPGDRERGACNAPRKTLSPRRGNSVGGVSERVGRDGGAALAPPLGRARDGERHPGLLEGGALRGAPVGTKSSVGPAVRASVPPMRALAPTTADARRAPRRGTPSACAIKRMHPVLRERACSGDASFARSFDPCASILTLLRGASLGGGAFEAASRLGKLARARRTSTGVVTSGRTRGSPRTTAPAREGVARQRRKEVVASVPARFESSGLVARTSCAVCRNRQATSGLEYARQPRSKKSGQGRVNRDLARGTRRLAGEGNERKGGTRVGLTAETRERTGTRPRVTRDRHPAVASSPRGGGAVAGPGL